MTPTAFAPAKVNLFLHVAPPQPDGFHPLSSLMVFADVGDQIDLEPSDRLELVIRGPFGAGLGAGPDNLVLRAVHALFAAAADRSPPFRLVLTKLLPIAAGLGGGSSDAGAALRLVRDHFALAVDDDGLERIAAALGSDGAACFRCRPVIAEGRGERLRDLDGLPVLDAVLVNPGVPSPTGAVYRAYDAAGAPGSARVPQLPARFENAAHVAALMSECRNDLEPPAVAMTPPIGVALEAIRAAPEALLARVSGSGATCFALCADSAKAAALSQRLSDAHPHWWVRACRLA
jgi:4-diphosphocytidyl-2-C-methyl-D-erythritol kinase